MLLIGGKSSPVQMMSLLLEPVLEEATMTAKVGLLSTAYTAAP